MAGRQGGTWGGGGGAGGGGFRDAMRRMFNADNPMGMSIPVMRVSGITVRLHIIFVLYVVIEWAAAASQGAGTTHAIGLGLLFLIVLLHEFGHCFACRWVGGQADEVLLWPLGGLAYCRPPHRWKADFITTAGGPLVNVLLVPISAAAVWLAVGSWDWDLFIFNPFRPSVPLGMLTSWWAHLAWWFYYTNLALLAFNALLPMYPMDGGRLWQALLWSRIGFRKSMLVAANTGIIAAMAVALIAIATGAPLLLGIAIMGGLTCWSQITRLKYMSVTETEDDDPYGLFKGRKSWDGAEQMPEEWPAGGDSDAASTAQAELDRILAKIAKTGMGSLSGKERRFLQQDTERRRGA